MTNLAVQSNTPSANSALAAGSTTATGSNKAGAGSATGLTQSDFLQLLTAQLQYQSPTSPSDPTQLASEFAQISTVTGVNQINATLSSMQTSQAASQLTQAAGLVGKQIALNGNTLTPNASGVATGAFNLSAAASAASVTIAAPNGTVAGTLSLGQLPAGQNTFSWSGGTPGTSYTYSVSAKSASGAPPSVTPYSVDTVVGVNAGGTDQTVNVLGSATPVSISSIQSVLGS
ncbi:flagellar hook assembly protein FlgD [Acidisoma sp. C75]